MVLQEELRDKADKIFAPVVGKSPAHKKAKEGNYDNIEMNKIPAMPGAGNTAKTGNKDGKEAVEEEDEDMGIKEEVAVAGEEAAAAAAAATPLATASAATARASNEVRTPQQLQQLQQQHQQSSTKQLLLEKITVYLAASLERAQIKANSSTLYTTGWPWSWSSEQREQAVFANNERTWKRGKGSAGCIHVFGPGLECVGDHAAVQECQRHHQHADGHCARQQEREPLARGRKERRDHEGGDVHGGRPEDGDAGGAADHRRRHTGLQVAPGLEDRRLHPDAGRHGPGSHRVLRVVRHGHQDTEEVPERIREEPPGRDHQADTSGAMVLQLGGDRGAGAPEA